MSLTTSGIRMALAAAALALLAGCDDPKPRGPMPAEGLPPPGPREAAGAAAPDIAPDAPPPTPAWATALIGQPAKTLFPRRDGACVGNTDAVTQRYKGASPSVRILGWAWDPAAKAPPAHILLVDEADRIVGVGETGVPRADVTAARKDITSPDTGWAGYTSQTSGKVAGWAIMPDGKTLCPLGHLSL